MSLKLPRNWDFSTFKADPSRIARSRSVVPGEGGGGGGNGGGGGSGLARSSKPMDRPLKAGWLKKQQRGLVKNWQQRYFVLRGTTLTYHKDKDTAVQGVIPVSFSKVNELLLNSDDPGKYLFEIVPRSTPDQERSPIVLMSSSQADLDEWVRALRKVVGVPTNGVFGKSLEDTVTYEQRFGPRTVPILVQKCVEFIKEHGLDEEGIFRLPGQDNAVKQFRDAFDAGERPSFPSDTDVHTVASLLKLYLRELPVPVVPWTQYHDFLSCTDSLDSEGWNKLEQQVALLPRINYNLLSYICRFLFEVQRHAAVNKMNVENLATVMGINLLKPQIEDPFTMMKATPQIQNLMTVLIRQHEALFPPSKDVLPSPPRKKAESQKNTPRSFVGWESAEMGDASLSESPEEDDDNDSLDLDRRRHSPISPPLPNLHVESPRKRTQTLPTFNCPLTGMAAKAEAVNRWSRLQETLEEKSSGTFSEDIFKILDLRTSGSLFGRPTTTTREEEEEKEEKKEVEAAVAAGGSDDKASADAGPRKANSDSQGSSEKPASIPSTQQVHRRPEEKRDNQQLPDSLRQENEELRAKVSELQSALEESRRRVAALELSLKNAERSRDEVQRREQELQRDVQRFHSTQAPT